MKHLIEATYADGVLRPTRKLDLDDGDKVTLILIKDEGEAMEKARALANTVYDDLSERDLREIEQIALTSRGFAEGGSIDRAE